MRVAIGEDSHRIDYENKDKKLILGGVIFDENYSLFGNSDSDVIYHSLTNAISGITTVNILGKKADEMCKRGITDSKEYLLEALSYLKYKITHVSISIECKVPKITPKIEEIRDNISSILNLDRSEIGITATTGEGLTGMGKGEGIFVTTIIVTE